MRRGCTRIERICAVLVRENSLDPRVANSNRLLLMVVFAKFLGQEQGREGLVNDSEQVMAAVRCDANAGSECVVHHVFSCSLPRTWPSSCSRTVSKSMRCCSPWLPAVVNSLSLASVGSTNQPQPAALASSQMVWPEGKPGR